MRVAVVYREKIPELLLRILGSCTTTETALFNSRKTDDDFISRWRPDVVLYHLEDASEEQFARLMMAHARHSVARLPAFSFSFDVNPTMAELSEQLGFIAHLESILLTPQELELHLKYGLRLAKASNKVSAQSNSFDKAFEAVTSFHSSLDRDKVVESAMLHLPRLVPADSWALYLSTESGHQMRLVAAVNVSRHFVPQSINVDDETNPLVQVVREGKARVVTDDTGSGEMYLYLPLLTHASLFGGIRATLQLGHHVFTEEETEIAERVSASLAVALSNAISFTRAENLCQLDDLTHLFNSRFFYQSLENELKRSRRYELHLALIFLDLDGFKSVNDELGHLVGSGTLVEVAQILHGVVRETDILCRYGGDEFVVALPETTAEQAQIIAERIRSRIESTVFQKSRGCEVRLTCSLGVSAYPDHAVTTEELIKKADLAMYDAKQAQKNRVFVAKFEAVAS